MNIRYDAAQITAMYNFHNLIVPPICRSMDIETVIKKVRRNYPAKLSLTLVTTFEVTEKSIEKAAILLGTEIKELEYSEMEFIYPSSMGVSKGLRVYKPAQSIYDYVKVFTEMCTDLKVRLDIHGDSGSLSVKILHN